MRTAVHIVDVGRKILSYFHVPEIPDATMYLKLNKNEISALLVYKGQAWR